jgi:transposase
MTSFPMRTVTTRDIAEMEALADKGLNRSAIARKTGWSYATVKRYVGAKVPVLPQDKRRAYPDVARYRRMLKAVQGASYGEWDGIAKRFGLKSAHVLNVTLVTARKHVAFASQTNPLGTIKE